jgi:hypothetical protein
MTSAMDVITEKPKFVMFLGFSFGENFIVKHKKVLYNINIVEVGKYLFI